MNMADIVNIDRARYTDKQEMQMGMDQLSMRFVRMAMSHIGVHENNCRLCELGNQHVRGTGLSYKQLFTGHHVSIDLNKEDGALPYDLTQPVSSWVGFSDYPFDVVTNFGTSEHCHDQAAVFLTIHTLCRVGGAMVFGMPLEHNWPGHGQFLYRPNFLVELAKRCGYRLIESMPSYSKGPSRGVLFGIAVRDTEHPFDFSGMDQFMVRDATAKLDQNNLKHQ